MDGYLDVMKPLAAFLDPCLKNHPFLSPIELNDLHDLISQEAGQIAKSNHSAVDKIDIETDSAAQKSAAEVAMCLSQPDVTENPLLWWKLNSFRYPMLSTLAKKYLAKPVYFCAIRESFQCCWPYCQHEKGMSSTSFSQY
uniref:HAT C-terminal dimerisation domain-containing protein n=1 Tax=Amphimedon queenslandica TaxID=400682 RepID=A0A1X7UYH7_AMPQE